MFANLLFIFFIIILIISGIWDFKTYTMPNILTIPLIPLGFLYAVLNENIYNAVLGFSFSFILGLFFWAINGMGGGDVKLMASIGIWLGLETSIFILFLGSIFALLWVFIRFIKEKTFKTKVKKLKTSIQGLICLQEKGFHLLSANKFKKPIPFGSCLTLATLIITIQI